MANTREIAAASQGLAARAHLTLYNNNSVRQSRSISLAQCSSASLLNELGHHAGEAYCSYSGFVAGGGTEILAGNDDLANASSRTLSMPENLLDRLDAVFVGLERLGGSNGHYRSSDLLPVESANLG